MAGGSDMERTEAPTPKRRQEAREEGRVPRSQELTTAVLLLGTAMILSFMGPALGQSMLAIVGFGLTAAGSVPLDGNSAVQLLRGLGWRVLASLSSLLAAMALIVLAVNAAQARGVISAKPLGPNWDRLNPLENAKRMLGLQPWAELAKSLLKLVIVGAAVYASLRAAWPDLMALSQQSPPALLFVVKRYALRLLMTAGLSYLGLALVDYLYQLWQYERSLKMSKEEIKQEMKQSEGDPMVKQRMRSMGRALARRQMMRDVPKADVVITNPTHIAVALLYDPDRAPAPLVLAMGQRKVAERIKQIAFEAGVPVIENKPLARALLASARVGTMIPAELYAAVAEVLAFVIRQRALAPSRWKGNALA